MSDNPQNGDRFARFKDVGEFVFAAVLTLYGVFGYYIVRDQLSVMRQQTVVMQQQTMLARQQLADARKAAAEGDAVIQRQLRIAEQQALSQKTLADANKDIAIAAKNSAGAAKRSADSSKAIADTASAQLEATDRAWLKPDIAIASPLTWSATGAHIDIKVNWVNIGRSAANSVGASVRIISRAGSSMRIVSEAYNAKEIQDECRKAATLSTNDYPVGNITWPGESPSTFRVVVLDIPSAQIPAEPLIRHVEGWPGEYWAPQLIGCVAYRLIYSGQLHYTTFDYEIRRNNSPTPLIEIGKDVPLPDLELVENESEGNGAN